MLLAHAVHHSGLICRAALVGWHSHRLDCVALQFCTFWWLMWGGGDKQCVLISAEALPALLGWQVSVSVAAQCAASRCQEQCCCCCSSILCMARVMPKLVVPTWSCPVVCLVASQSVITACMYQDTDVDVQCMLSSSSICCCLAAAASPAAAAGTCM